MLTKNQYKDCILLFAKSEAYKDSLSISLKQIDTKNQIIHNSSILYERLDRKYGIQQDQIKLYKSSETAYKKQVGILKKQVKIRDIVIGISVGIIIIESSILIIKSI